MDYQEQTDKVRKELKLCTRFIGVEVTSVVISTNIAGTTIEFYINSILVSFKVYSYYSYQDIRQVIVKKLSEYISP
jgi:hypothetical protein